MSASAADYKRALEEIAERVATDEWGGWTDECGILESIGSICEGVGINVPNKDIE